MNRNFVILFLLLFSAVITAQEYTLVWQDNFDGSSLDENVWTPVVNGKGGGNRELQYYRKENVSVGKEPLSGENCLIITAKKENYRFHRCTSGRISTSGKIGFRYGKIEARMKLPKTADGLWPAFWMLGFDYPKAVWPRCGEIDIMEMGNKDGIADGVQERHFGGACHWGEKFNHGRYPNFSRASVSSYSLQEDFHLYTLIWDDNSIRMYLDSDKNPAASPYFEMPLKGDSVPNQAPFYFKKPFFIIFNLAVGGNYTHIHKTSKVSALNNGSAQMFVDFVRVYQRNAPEDIFIHNSK